MDHGNGDLLAEMLLWVRVRPYNYTFIVQGHRDVNVYQGHENLPIGQRHRHITVDQGCRDLHVDQCHRDAGGHHNTHTRTHARTHTASATAANQGRASLRDAWK